MVVCDGSGFRPNAENVQLQRQRPKSALMTKQVLSLLIVDVTVLPAIFAGMCYFALRAIDDVVLL